MADEYIADVVRKGAKAIQHWRENHPGAALMLVGLDLSRLNLVGADLSGANLTGCNMHLVHLIGANLAGAKLTSARLRGANLVGANLASADLRNSVLTGAILQNANLQGADLRGANLRRADLRGSVLHGADLEGTDFKGAILTEAEQAQIGGIDASLSEISSAFVQTEVRLDIELGRDIAAEDLARLLKALDDIQAFIRLRPAKIEQVVINAPRPGPDPKPPDQPENRLVVRLNQRVASWLEESMGPALEDLRSQQERTLRYKKLGMSEEDVWHNLRTLLDDASDPLAVLRDLFQKNVLLSVSVQPDTEPPPKEPPLPEAQAALLQAAPVDESLRGEVEQLSDADWSVRSSAAERLGNLGPAARAAMPHLMRAAEDENIFVREAAEEAIKKITGNG